MKPQSNRSRSFDLGGDESFAASGKDVEMIGGGRAARQSQLCQAGLRRGVDHLLVEPCPDWVKQREPVEQCKALTFGEPARERLIEVMMGVYQTGNRDEPAAVERLVEPVRFRNLAHLGDPSVLDGNRGIR